MDNKTPDKKEATLTLKNIKKALKDVQKYIEELKKEALRLKQTLEILNGVRKPPN